MASISIVKTISSPPAFYNSAGLTAAGGVSMTIDPAKFSILNSVKI